MDVEAITNAIYDLSDKTRNDTIKEILATLDDFATDVQKNYDEEFIAGYMEAIAIIKANHSVK